MFSVRGRPIALGAAALGVAVAGTFVYLATVQRQTADIAIPARNATPEQVVTTYLDALNAHDCETAEAVMMPDAKDQASSWCDDVASLTDIDVEDHLKGGPRSSGHPASKEVVDVPVNFNLNWRLFHNDGSMDEGDTSWGYILVRESPDAPWRITDQGTG